MSLSGEREIWLFSDEPDLALELLGSYKTNAVVPPAFAKLTSMEIWAAIKANDLKLPNTISIDSMGRVFLTPHQVSYTLSPKLQRLNFEHIVSGNAGRSFLDKVQVRRDASPLSIAPRSGILTSCSMYLKEHYVVLNQGEGNFGIHTSAVLLDPIKTFGTNVMLEIYNTGDQPVVNPMVSVDIFRAPPFTDPEFKTLAKKRQRLLGTATELFKCLDANPPRDTGEAHPRTKITVRGQSGTTEGLEAWSLYLDDLAKFGYDTDLKKSGNDLTGTSYEDSNFRIQRIQTYSVGLAINNQMLKDAAEYGQGKSYTANDADQLQSVLQSTLNDIAGQPPAVPNW